MDPGSPAYDVVIVGTGHGGAHAAAALRRAGFAGSIAMVGDELDPPYERPPLSKELLSGAKSFEQCYLRPPAFWPDNRVDLRLGTRIVAVDAARHRVALANGAELGYGVLVWSAGGEPHRLRCEGSDLAGVHVIRRRADIDALRSDLAEAERIVIVGGGYVGLEAAATLTKLRKSVVVVEALDRVLARVATEPLSRFVEAEHRARGVEVVLNATVRSIYGTNGRAAAVVLADGRSLPCDVAIVGIGIGAMVGPLAGAGARISDGVDVDAYCRTTLPDVYAIGDCANFESRYAGGARVRIESVQNACDQAATVAGTITGNPRPYDAVPWFWSEQYDLRLQMAGLHAGADDAVVRGTAADRRFSLVHLKAGRLVAIDCVNSPKDFVQAKALIVSGTTVNRASLADPSIPLSIHDRASTACD